MQSGQTAGCGHRVAAECAGLIHRTQRRELFHDSAFATKGCKRHAAANHFAQHRHVGFETGDGFGVHALRAAQRHTAAGHDFVKHQQGAVLRTQFAAAFHEGDAGAHKIHIARDGFDHQTGEFFAM